MPIVLLLSLIPFSVGVVFLVVAISSFSRTQKFLSQAQETKGTVVEMVFGNSGSNSTYTYTPIYQFRAMNGQMIVVKDGLGSSPPQFEVGQEIDVLYNPENPQEAQIKKWSNLYFFTAMMALMGMLFSGVGLAIGFSDLMALLGF